MTQLTIFSAPKPFLDPHIATIQRNAIQSWLQMGPEVEIILIGDERGMPEVCKEFGVQQVKDVACNEQGTPLISSIFSRAQEVGQSDLFLFTNTDILFFPETLELALKVKQQAPQFALLGQRYDLDVSTPIDFSAGWADRLRAEVSESGHLHPMGGSDYFLFPRGAFAEIPDFAVGRAGWDNWMIYYAAQQPWPAIDATADLMIVHQNHDYSHLATAGGHQRHPETFANTALGGGMRKMYMLLDVDHELVNGQMRPARWTLARFLRSLERRLQPDERVAHGLRWPLLRLTRRLRRAVSRSEAN